VAYTTAWEGGTIETAIVRACLAGLFFITKFLFITKEVELLGSDRNTTHYLLLGRHLCRWRLLYSCLDTNST
jgi:hypothetical protein